MHAYLIHDAADVVDEGEAHLSWKNVLAQPTSPIAMSPEPTRSSHPAWRAAIEELPSRRCGPFGLVEHRLAALWFYPRSM